MVASASRLRREARSQRRNFALRWVACRAASTKDESSRWISAQVLPSTLVAAAVV